MPGIAASIALIAASALGTHPVAVTPVVPAPAPVCAPSLGPVKSDRLLRAVEELLAALYGDLPACPAAQGPVQEPQSAAPAPRADNGGVVNGIARLPADLLDLTDWYLTLPTGSDGKPENVEQPDLQAYTGEHFRLNAGSDGVEFRANAGGVTTKNSSYPRSELREMTGTEHASWSNRQGTHVLEVRQAITEVPAVKPEVVAAQIHDGDDDVLQIRLEGPVLSVQYDDGDEQIVLDRNYRLGTPYDLKIVAADSRILVSYNGVQKAAITESGSGWYWKVGAYTQSNPEKGDSADAVGEVVVYSLKIEHTEA